MKKTVFLSAGIPVPTRAITEEPPQADRIADAVLALVEVCQELDLGLCFGGQPSISPLVHHAAASLGNLSDITIYQSRFFEDILPESAKQFPNLVFTSIVSATDSEESRSKSLRQMRLQMLDPLSWNHIAAVFVGGMQGILDEAELFAKLYPDAPLIPLVETGGAARVLTSHLSAIDRRRILELEDEKSADCRAAYNLQLYRRLVDIDGDLIAKDSPDREIRAQPLDSGRRPLRWTPTQSPAVAATAKFGARDSDPVTTNGLSLSENKQFLRAHFAPPEFSAEDFPAKTVLITAINRTVEPPRPLARRLMVVTRTEESGPNKLVYHGSLNLQEWHPWRNKKIDAESVDYECSLLNSRVPDLAVLLGAVPETKLTRHLSSPEWLAAGGAEAATKWLREHGAPQASAPPSNP